MITTSAEKPADTEAKNLPVQANSALVTTHGKTTIADTVVEKIAGLAAREVSGVYALGGGVARAFGAVRERIPGAKTSLAQGVSVEVGERQAAVDLDIVVEYGVEIGELTKAIRRNVITAIERMTALEVTEVNIAVGDVHIEGDDNKDDDSDAARVQ
ncbi:putative alkaline shock family protein YloU [Nakamurella sp. UYEF19]|uniref:Asp23/Gls24 family envelope stress response protein n=1 Tax=Nakamurella sp. UYEF19 TaxID=1756392 RepID=UPI003399611B